jgi:competence protein ComEC
MQQILANLLTAERHRLPLWLPVGVGIGIALYFVQAGPLPLWPYLTGLVASALLCIIGWKHSILRFPALIAATLLLGVCASSIRFQAADAPILRDPIFFKIVEATVEDIQHKEKKVKLVLNKPVIETLSPENTPLRISITLKKLEVPVVIGDRIRMPATLFAPPAPAMPGAYDFARMFYFQQMGAVGFSPRQPEVLEQTRTDDWQDKLTALRLSISDHLVASMGEEMGAIASALMVGEQSRVPEAVSESMRASGIYHILSISGLHMSLATGIIFMVVRFLLVLIPRAARNWPNKKIAAIAGLLGGFAYLMLAGAPVPAIRSYIMAACVLGAILMDRKGISMFSLGWAATLILLFMPESLFTASFQLTFAATLAIVGLYERYGNLLFHAHAGIVARFFLYFAGLMITSLAVTFYTAPLAIIHFNRMAIYGILANMLIVPLSSFWIMPMAMLSFLTMPFGLDSWPLAGLKLGLEWMMKGSYFVSNFPYANISVPAPSNMGVMLIVAGGLWFALWSTRMRWMGFAALVVGLSTIALFKPYDLIISDDAKRVAYRTTDGQWVLLRGNIDSFESEVWLRTQGAEGALTRTQAKKTIPEIACDKTTCQITRGSQTIVVAVRKGDDNLCESGADLVITSRYLNCHEIPSIIDRRFAERHGASAIRWKDGGFTIGTAQERRGDWPWVKAGLAPGEDDAMMPENPSEIESE